MKKKKNIGLEILKAFGSILAFIAIAFIFWIALGLAERSPSYTAIPVDFSLYARTDSAWNSVEPLLDLRAAEILLSDPSMASARNLLFKLRNSELRNKWFVKAALKRRVDLAFYGNGDYLAVVDSGLLASPVRMLPLLFGTNVISVKNLSLVEETQTDSRGKNFSNDYFMYSNIYGRIKKNLIIISSNKELLDLASTLTCGKVYTEEKYKLVNSRLKEQFLIAADGRKLAQSYLSSPESESSARAANSSNINFYMKYVSSHLAKDKLSRISFNITDEAISFRSNFALDLTEDFEKNPMGKLLSLQSGIPQLITKLPPNVQYYTFINSSTLEDLKNAAFSCAPPSTNLNAVWKSAESASQLFFGKSLEEILFSWTDDEYAVIGIEGKAENIFAMKIKDEEKRQYVFEKVLSSIIFRSNDSLLIDGVRLPRIEVPEFFQNILKSFSINVPSPYYVVKDGYVFFSQSPENLASLYFESERFSKARTVGSSMTSSSLPLLVNTQNWKKVSENQSLNATISLFYNLERSVPFFLQRNSLFSKILKLYNIGRFDVLTKNDTLFIELDAISVKNAASNVVSGFPIELAAGNNYSELYLSSDKKNSRLFFLEGANLCSLDLYSFEKKEILVPDAKRVEFSADGVWVQNERGILYLFDKDLNEIAPFPIVAPKANGKLVSYSSDLVFASGNNSLVRVNKKGEIFTYTNDFSNVVSEPVVLNKSAQEKILAFYDKGFFGRVLLASSLGESTEKLKVSELPVFGIGFASPAFFQSDKHDFVGFITQGGEIFTGAISKDGNFLTDETSQTENLVLDGVFSSNLKVASSKTGSKLIALAEDGKLFSVDSGKLLSGQTDEECFIQVAIPYFSAKTSCVTIADYDDDGEDEIFVSGNGDLIYGFRNNLDILPAFPVSGHGNCVFTDVNADGKKDCVVRSLDGKLYAYKVQ